jgi:antitoxin Phd
MHSWQLQEAKNKFSEVVDKACEGDPQVITRRGAEVAVLISFSEYKRMTAPRQSLVEFLLNSPLAGSELNLVRDQGPDRDPLDL